MMNLLTWRAASIKFPSALFTTTRSAISMMPLFMPWIIQEKKREIANQWTSKQPIPISLYHSPFFPSKEKLEWWTKRISTWSWSPPPGATSRVVKSQMDSTTTSDWPTPTVSIKMVSYPAALRFQKNIANRENIPFEKKTKSFYNDKKSLQTFANQHHLISLCSDSTYISDWNNRSLWGRNNHPDQHGEKESRDEGKRGGGRDK